MREAGSRTELITTAEAARILGRTPDTVRWMARTGRIEVAVQTDAGIRLFSRRLIEALAAERRAASARLLHRARVERLAHEPAAERKGAK
jgi:hypothetical protein